MSTLSEDDKLSRLLEGGWDTHVHPGPDVIPRRFDVVWLAAALKTAGMRGAVIKSHAMPTFNLAAVMKFYSDVRLVGSIALNPPVGGFNPWAVEACLRVGKGVVFMPTYSAAHHMNSPYSVSRDTHPYALPKGGGLSVLGGNGEVIPEVMEILALIRDRDGVLSTGHLSPRESLAVVHAAKEVGVKRIVITHASVDMIDMPQDMQVQLAQLGCLIEHVYLACTDVSKIRRKSPAEVASDIRAVGSEHCVIGTDVGLPQLPDSVQALRSFIKMLMEEGISESEISRMVRHNPEMLFSEG